MKLTFFSLVVAAMLCGRNGRSAEVDSAEAKPWLAPVAMAVSPDGKMLYVAEEKGKQVQVLDLGSNELRASYPLPLPPSGLVVMPDGSRLLVTCAGPQSQVVILEAGSGKEVFHIPTGHTAMAPVLGANGAELYVCCRFENAVAVLDLANRKELTRIRVEREPVAAALTRDGRFLLVANLLPAGRADAEVVAASVSVIDVEKRRVVKQLGLPNGSESVNDIAVSPDGRYAAVTHLVARFTVPATQLERGWINTNAKTLIDLSQMKVVDTVLLDSVECGAANPWGVAWSGDGKQIVVAQAGTHELSVIDFPALLERLQLSRSVPSSDPGVDTPPPSVAVNDLAFLTGIRRRIRLPGGDRGPRAVLVQGTRAIAANYFSDTLSVIDLASESPTVASTPLAPEGDWDLVRKGNSLFHDAGICFQGWQSCMSCHPGEGRVDGLNWDLINDGIGNPKNGKSLLLAHRTPPAMSLGVRQDAAAAVRAGVKHVLFTVQPDDVPKAIYEYVKSLLPVPSPYLRGGRLSPAAERGQQVFWSSGCASCHPPGLFTNLKTYDVGTRAATDRAEDSFDTPTLIEVWRTAPYLHDGSAATLREVFAEHNPQDRHGRTSHLTSEELDALCEFVLSL